MPYKRPRLVTWLAVGVLLIAALYWIRLLSAWNEPPLPLTAPSWYLPLTGAFWGVTGFAAAYGLFFGHPWAPTLLRVSSALYAIWFWSDWLLFVRADYARGSWPANVFLTVFGLAGVFCILRQPAVFIYFQEKDS